MRASGRGSPGGRDGEHRSGESHTSLMNWTTDSRWQRCMVPAGEESRQRGLGWSVSWACCINLMRCSARFPSAWMSMAELGSAQSIFVGYVKSQGDKNASTPNYNSEIDRAPSIKNPTWAIRIQRIYFGAEYAREYAYSLRPSTQ